jgi:TatD DNase family protein
LETDSPYLAPVPHRGNPNEPAYIRDIAEYLASIKEIPFEDIENKTSKNATKIFHI